MAHRICSIDDCERQVKARSWCSTHYSQFRRTGSPTGSKRRIGPTACAFEGCDRPGSTRRGYCQGHYAQQWRGEELRPLRTKRATRTSTIRDGSGRKQCHMCEEWKPESDFYGHSGTSDRLDTRCIACTDKRRRERSASDPREALKRHVHSHGMTLAQYDAMMERQGGQCAICLRSIREDERKRMLSIDHDHSCCPGRTSCGACVRGLLCGTCNSGLGYFQDRPDLLRAALDYLTQ